MSNIDTDECDGDHIERPHRYWYGERGQFSSQVCRRFGCKVMGTGDRCNDGECEGRVDENERTIDGRQVKIGMRVWDYDLRVAIVGPIAYYEVGNPWYSTTREDGSRGKDFDAKRMWYRDPSTGELA